MEQLELPLDSVARWRLHLLSPFPAPSDPDSPDPIGLYLSRLPKAPAADDPAFVRWGLGPVEDLPRKDLSSYLAEQRVSTIFLGQLRR